MASGAEPPQGEAELRAAGGASSDAHGAAGHPRAGGRQPGEAELPQLLRLRWPGVSAGFTTRRGGVSRPPFASLNGGLHVGDDPADVVANRERLAASIGRPFAACTYAEQVHGTKVLVATHEHRGRGRATREDAVQGTDAFVTAERGLVLCTQFADCVPLFIHDPVRQVVGLAHAGWKGSVLNIAQATVSAMARAFGSRPQELRAAVGPSIGVCCYEVDATVADRVREALAAAGAAPQAEAAVLQPRPNGKFMLNLQEFNRNLLEQAGILSPCIEVTQLCTSCRTDLFFSHRKEGGSTGRMIAWIALE
ncbi:peptidoglycan editing factor PgeF [Paenibacillus athensensis]|uniref:Purine nucleoside phosphorylase n=2 Tax=Paenibacillus athensensis TaxID=1967502 RepID=A0A4Y8PTU9_9BACL|nr:peptidoglycan editing factor PgeF [Paenibacillus athensensis]